MFLVFYDPGDQDNLIDRRSHFQKADIFVPFPVADDLLVRLLPIVILSLKPNVCLCVEHLFADQFQNDREIEIDEKDDDNDADLDIKSVLQCWSV